VLHEGGTGCGRIESVPERADDGERLDIVNRIVGDSTDEGESAPIPDAITPFELVKGQQLGYGRVSLITVRRLSLDKLIELNAGWKNNGACGGNRTQ